MRLPARAVLASIAALAVALNGAPAGGNAQRAATSSGPVRFADYATGFEGGEPTLGVLRDGSIIVQAFLSAIKSRDDGRTWHDTHLAIVPETFDPYIHVDAETDRIFSSQLLVACQEMSISDDGGETWQEAPTQCGTGDHQKIGSGPWHDPSNKLYPSAVYSCVNHVAQTACAMSYDGGITWGPLVTVFPGFDPTAEEGLDVPGFCGGLEGDPVSGPDGTIYLPREYCGRPFVGVSKDDGLTWSRHHVAGPKSKTRPIAWGGNNPSVTVTDDGTLHYAWTGADWRHYVARSTDQGETWSKALQVSPPDVKSSTFPSIIGGRKGAVATSYVGTRDSNAGPDEADKESKWYLFVSYSFNAHSRNPVWRTFQATEHPVMIGCIGRHGANCGKGQLLDFNDMALTRDGRVAISYTDACVEACDSMETSSARMVSVAVQTSGPGFK